MAAKKTENLVRIRLPRPIRDEENFVIVTVNDRSWKIMKGEWVEVPDYVAEVIAHSERMQDENAAYIAEVANRV